jgi:hypothetical protein
MADKSSDDGRLAERRAARRRIPAALGWAEGGLPRCAGDYGDSLSDSPSVSADIASRCHSLPVIASPPPALAAGGAASLSPGHAEE